MAGITTPQVDQAILLYQESNCSNYPLLRSLSLNSLSYTQITSGDTKMLLIGGETLPVTMVIDKEGNIREPIEGILLPEEFEEKIKPLLQ